jgi:hypothetical protein
MLVATRLASGFASWHSGYERRKDAERALSKILTQLDSSSYVEPAKLTVESFLADEWLPAVEETLRPLSVTRYRSTIRSYITPRIGHVRLQGLSAGHLNALYAELKREACRSRRGSSSTP